MTLLFDSQVYSLEYYNLFSRTVQCNKSSKFGRYIDSKMTLSEYSQLKQYIVFSVGTNERHSQILSSLKELFRDNINSVRRFEQINSIGQLLKVLEIRDLLSEDNVEPLKTIALQVTNSKDVLKKITDYENFHVPRESGNYYGEFQKFSILKPLKQQNVELL